MFGLFLAEVPQYIVRKCTGMLSISARNEPDASVFMLCGGCGVCVGKAMGAFLTVVHRGKEGVDDIRF